MEQRRRSLCKKLELATYAHDKVVTFNFASKSKVLAQPGKHCSVPLPIMYRYHHVGRAYDLHQLKNLQPTGSSAFDFISVRLLVQELEQISGLMDDLVLRYYSRLLVPYLKSAAADTKDTLVLHVPG